MKRRISIGVCLLFGLSVLAFEVGGRGIAEEALPDASVVAYWAHRPPNPPVPPRISEVTLTGIIYDLQPAGLTITAGKTSRSKNQKQWIVLAPSDTTALTIHGTATLDFMRTGQIVEFSSQIVSDEKGVNKAKAEKVADKIDELTIVFRKGGAAARNKGGTKDAAAKPGVAARIAAPKPAADPETILMSSDDSDSKADDSGKPAATHETVANGAKRKIVGRIERCDAKNLMVTCGQRTLHVDLAEVPTIHVELSNLKLVQDGKDASKSRIEGKGASGHLAPVMVSDLIGSKIVVEGTAVETKSSRQCTAKSIEITLAKPLSGKKSASTEAKKTVAEKW